MAPISREEAEEAAGRQPGAAGWTPGPQALKRLHETGMLERGDGQPVDVRTPAERAPGKGEDPSKAYRWHPGDLRIPIESLREKYDPEVWAQFEAAAGAIRLDGQGRLAGQGGTSLLDWLQGAELTAPLGRGGAGVVRPVVVGGDPMERLTPKVRRTVEKAERMFDGLPVEMAAVVTEDGRALLSRTGTRQRVRLTGEQLGALRGNVLTHWHVTGGSFSLEDMERACRHGAVAVRAVTPRGVYMAAPPHGRMGVALFHNVREDMERFKNLPDAEKTERRLYDLWISLAERTGINYSYRRKRGQQR